MATDQAVRFKLTIWRDFVPPKSLIFRLTGENSQQSLTAHEDLQQEVYSWQTREDPFDGISQDEDRARLRALLFDSFDPALPPSERRVYKLKDLLDEAKRILDSALAEWTISQDAPIDDEEVPFRLNALLSLTLHLEWLFSTYKGQPGVSVSMR